MVGCTEISSSVRLWPFPTCLKIAILEEIGHFGECRKWPKSNTGTNFSASNHPGRPQQWSRNRSHLNHFPTWYAQYSNLVIFACFLTKCLKKSDNLSSWQNICQPSRVPVLIAFKLGQCLKQDSGRLYSRVDFLRIAVPIMHHNSINNYFPWSDTHTHTHTHIICTWKG